MTCQNQWQKKVFLVRDRYDKQSEISCRDTQKINENITTSIIEDKLGG